MPLLDCLLHCDHYGRIRLHSGTLWCPSSAAPLLRLTPEGPLRRSIPSMPCLPSRSSSEPFKQMGTTLYHRLGNPVRPNLSPGHAATEPGAVQAFRTPSRSDRLLVFSCWIFFFRLILKTSFADANNTTSNGWACDRWGYRKTIGFSLIAMAAFIAVTFTAVRIEVLLVGEFLCGMPWGVFQVRWPGQKGRASERC